MLNRNSLALMLVTLLVALASCKSNENNYRRAYDRAIAGREAAVDPDQTVYTKIRREMKHGEMVVDGQKVDVGTQMVAVTEGGGGINENLRRYCVVAGQFKQVFNAKSMRERMVENGYPGAFVVNTREPYYYVIAGSYSDAHQAMEMINRLRADKTFQIKPPLPFILNPAQIR